MKRSNHKTIKLYLNAVLAVAAMALGWAGTAGAAPGGLPRCQNDLQTCNTNLSTCNSNLSQSQSNLATCNTNLDTCEADLAACEAVASGFPATGQTTVHRADDDGATQAGATLSYTVTSNGTVIDNNTGLEWEKKSNDEAANDNDNTTFPHDKDNIYSWENAFAVHVEGLNTEPCFAGACDWRLPNVKELQSIVNYQFFTPAVSSDAFKTPCAAGATVVTGSCTVAAFYWSSTTVASGPDNAWGVNFVIGNVDFVGKNGKLFVRAVRGGSP